MADTRFLGSFDLKRIAKGLSGARNVKIAVPFWGWGAAQKLGLSNSKGRVQVLCNLESSACDPYEIEKLMKRRNITVKTHSQLHAKVYLADGWGLIGSVNASDSALGFKEKTSRRRWREAAVETENVRLIAEAKKWFDDYWKKDAKRILKSELAAAKERWDIRPKLRVEPLREVNLREVVEYERRSRIDRTVLAFIYTEGASKKSYEEAAKFKKAKKWGKDWDHYQDDGQRFPKYKPGALILDLKHRSDGMVSPELWEIPEGVHFPERSSFQDDDGDMSWNFYVREVTRPTIPGLGVLKLSPEERTEIAKKVKSYVEQQCVAGDDEVDDVLTLRNFAKKVLAW